MSAHFDRFAGVSALRSAVRRAQPAHAEVRADLPQGAERLLWLLGAACARNRYGEHLQLQRWFAEPAGCAAPNGALEVLVPGGAGSGAACAADPAQWLFLDTETTGLAGGTGTYAFLVGVAWWEAGGLQVEQFFMRDYTEEHSMLEALAERLRQRPVLVTYNGKTFDWPLLETRYRMTRCIPGPEPAAHLDLLHAARVLWRLRLGSVRLAEIERQVLGQNGGLPWSRAGDVRSEMIPHIYFQFLRGGSPGLLIDVLRHNQMDLRGLALLAGRVIALLNDPEAAEADAHEWYGVSRMVRRRAPHQSKRARALFERSRQAGLPAPLDLAALRELAVLARRERDHARAAALWEELLARGAATLGCAGSLEADVAQPVGPGLDWFFSSRPAGERKLTPTQDDVAQPGVAVLLEALEQLAIHAERRLRDPARALAFTRAAMAALRAATRAGLVHAGRAMRLRNTLEKRRNRLLGEMGTAGEEKPPESADLGPRLPDFLTS